MTPENKPERTISNEPPPTVANEPPATTVGFNEVTKPTLELTPLFDAPELGHSRYIPIRHHARGGLGEVSVARDEELGREVALKAIRVQHADNPTNRARFIREAE